MFLHDLISDPNGALLLPQNTIKVPNWGAEVQHRPPEAPSEWVRLPGRQVSPRNRFLGADINKYQSVQRLVRKDIDGNAEMTGY